MAEYIRNIPSFPKSLKIKKRDEDELDERLNALTLNDNSEKNDNKVKKCKKSKKK